MRISCDQQRHSFKQARLSRDKRFDGTFYVAVKTTGIFCRPICPAPPPKETNVDYYLLAQNAMQDGYRPCLRCRPDSAPDSFAWKGVDTTVERAVRLMRQSPESSLSELAERLGISDRYLRALFNEKLGVSPKKFQLFDKLLFAKQMLHQSGLSIEQVAQASGFSSSRRLQSHLKDNFNLTPMQIRKSKPSECEKGDIALTLPVTSPYNWEQVRSFLALRAIPGVEDVSESSYSRSFTFGGTKGFYQARYEEAKKQFSVSLTLDNLKDIKPVINQIKRQLDTEAPVMQIHNALGECGIGPDCLNVGIRIPGTWSVFEAGIRAVLGQQVSVKGAITTLKKLVDHTGQRVGERVYFPTPEDLEEDDLQWLSVTNARRETLRRLAKFCYEFPQAGADEWMQIKGIGPWTVAYANMRGASQPDVYLSSDLVVKKVLAENSLQPDRASPWRSYLTMQLWSMAS